MNTYSVFSAASSRYESSNVHIPPSQLATKSLSRTHSLASTDTHFKTSFTSPSTTQTAAMQSMAVLSASPTSGSNNSGEDVILYALIAVCLVLAVIALLITVAIIILCCLTRRRNIHQVASPSGVYKFLYTGICVCACVLCMSMEESVRGILFNIGKVFNCILFLRILRVIYCYFVACFFMWSIISIRNW